jgi:hypothetical protein
MVPLPVFLLLHLARELGWAFANDISQMVRPTPGTLGLVSSALFVGVPLALHTLIGSWLLVAGRRLPALVDDVPASSGLVSRVSAVVALAFLAYHLAAFPLAVWTERAAASDAGFRLTAQLSSASYGVPLHGALYLVGLLATSTHAGLAMHRGLLRAGLLQRPTQRRRSARLCAAFGVLTFVLGAAVVIRVASGVLLR